MVDVIDSRVDGDPSLEVIPRIETFEELKTWFAVRVDETHGWTAAPNGSLVWRVVAFRLRTGAASFIAEFKDENGQKIPDAPPTLIAHSWPGAPAWPDSSGIVPDYSEGGGVVGPVENGDIGFGYGPDMAYSGSKPYTGIGLIWPLVPLHLPEPHYADCARGLGWVGGTDHLTVDPIFQLVRKQGTTPPPTGDSFIRVRYEGQEVGHIPVISDPGSSGGNALEIVIGGQMVGRVVF